MTRLPLTDEHSSIVTMAMASGAEVKANEYVEDAKKRLAAFSFFNKQAKYEDAAELYGKAATQFKLAKAWAEAGENYVLAGENALQASDEHMAYRYFADAAKAYKNVDSKEAGKLFQRVAKYQQDSNKFSMAAKTYKEMGELYEADMKVKEAADAFQHAADCFNAEDAKTNAQMMRLKIADFHARAEDFSAAVAIYEELAAGSLDNALTRWSVTKYLFKAGLCELAQAAKTGNVANAKSKQEHYKDMAAQFDGSRECKLVDSLLEAYEEQDLDKFEDVVAEFDNISRLDAWQSSLLLGVKKSISSAAENIDDDEAISFK